MDLWLRIKSWGFFGAWLAYLVVVGPYLISASDWALVSLGFVIFIGLTALSVRHVRQLLEVI